MKYKIFRKATKLFNLKIPTILVYHIQARSNLKKEHTLMHFRQRFLVSKKRKFQISVLTITKFKINQN